jgi:hypothetical protein
VDLLWDGFRGFYNAMGMAGICHSICKFSIGLCLEKDYWMRFFALLEKHSMWGSMATRKAVGV